MPEVLVSKDQVTDFEDVQAQISVSQNTTKNNVLIFTTRNNCKTYLAFLGMAWDANLNNVLTWRLLQDNGAIRQFKDSLVQIAPPEQPWQEITPWYLVPQGSTITFQVDIGTISGGGPGNVAARFRVYYVPLDVVRLK